MKSGEEQQMGMSKRDTELTALFSGGVKARSKWAKLTEQIEDVGGVPIDDRALAACFDACHDGKTALTQVEANKMIEKLHRGEFSGPALKRRTKGNGSKS
jgi:hypothetical protein